jgi:hypothetical protein
MKKLLMALCLCVIVSCDGVYSKYDHPFKHELRTKGLLGVIYNVQSYEKEGDFFKLTFIDGHVERIPISDVKSIKDY